MTGFFINDAFAEGAAASSGSESFMSFLPLIIIFALFYFLLIRPQTKRAKEHKQMVSTLAKGDEIVTGGGILGKITDVGDSFITVEITDSVKVKVQRHSITSLMPKGTVKDTVKSSA